nr:MAG TPA: hypothetical protein [Caudoviricetes sp.]
MRYPYTVRTRFGSSFLARALKRNKRISMYNHMIYSFLKAKSPLGG